MEVWKDVVGYEGKYKVSNKGRVKRAKITFKKRFWNTYREVTLDERVFKGSSDDAGYRYVKLSKKGIKKKIFIHRLVLNAFIGISNGKQTNHINGIKYDNRLENLEWVTSSENIQHAIDTGLMSHDHCTGEKHYGSKLTKSDVKKIRKMYKTGYYTQNEIANIYGVTKPLICLIINRKRWKHI